MWYPSASLTLTLATAALSCYTSVTITAVCTANAATTAARGTLIMQQLLLVLPAVAAAAAAAAVVLTGSSISCFAHSTHTQYTASNASSVLNIYLSS